MSFFRNTSNEYIIVLKNELDGKQKTTMEPRFNEEPWEWQHSRATQRRFPKFTENTFSVRTQSTLRCLEVHSKRRYKICTCSVILGKDFSKLQRASFLFSCNNVSRQWEFSWFLSQSHNDTDFYRLITPGNELKVNKYTRKESVEKILLWNLKSFLVF